MKKTISIILNITDDGHLEDCLSSIRENTPESYEILFIVRSSTDSPYKWIRKLTDENKDYHLIEVGGEKITPRDFNEAIKKASGEYIVLLNSNTIVTENWVSGMLEHIDRAQDIGIVGPMVNNLQGIQKAPDTDHLSVDSLEDYAGSFRKRNRYRHIPSRKINSFCMLFRRSLIDKIGLFDESLDFQDFMIEDFCLRTALDGYTNLIAGDVFVYKYSNKVNLSSKKPFTDKWSGIDIKSELGEKVLALNAIEKADTLFQKGNIDDAFETLMNAIDTLPDNKVLYYRLAEILINNSQFEDALDIINKMPNPEQDVRKLELIGYCKQGIGSFKEAEEIADQLISLNSAFAPALNLKGVVAYRDKNASAAESFFKRAIEIDPGYGEPYTNLGALKLDEGSRANAIDFYEKGFNLSPETMDIVTAYHTAITELQDFERAQGMFQNAAALHPDNQRLKYLFIDILLKQEKHHPAMKEIEDAISLFGADEGLLAAALNVRNIVGSHPIGKTDNKGSTISLCMIVKDEEEYLTRCLKSIKPVVDEIIIVDTGSSDKTKDIAMAFGAKVFDFTWTDDFSEARNFSISKAKKDWIFVLDADEVISPVDHQPLREIIAGAKHGDAAYLFLTRNYLVKENIIGWIANDGKYADEEAGTGWMGSIKVRLFRNDNRIRFQYPVHELVEPSLKSAGITKNKCNIPIHHYGKLNTKKTDSKGNAYYKFGKKKLEGVGDDIRAINELAIQTGIQGEYEEALELWKRVIAIKPDSSETYVNMSTFYSRLGKYEEALFASKKAIELAPKVKEGHFNYALCQLHLGNAKKAISALENLIEQLPEYTPAQFILTASYCCDGNKERCLKSLEKLRHTSVGPGLAISCHTLAKGLVSTNRIDYAIRLLEAAIENKSINKDVLALFAECIEKKLFLKPQDHEDTNV